MCVLALAASAAVASAAAAQVDSQLSDQQTNFGGTNGAVHALAVVGAEIWVGGDFTAAYDLDSSVPVARANLARFDYNTGELLGPVADLDGAVNALEFDGNGTVYAGGEFTSADGNSASHLVALNAVSGRPIASFSPLVDAAVHDLELHNGGLYVAGEYTGWNGGSGTNLIRIDPVTAVRQIGFDPNPQDKVWDIALRADEVYAAGYFYGVGAWENPILRRWAAGFDAATGAVLDADISLPALRPGEGVHKEEARAIGVSIDGTRVFVGDDRNVIRSFDSLTGSQQWAFESEGDIQAMAVAEDRLFVGNHQGWFVKFDGRILVSLNPANGQVRNDWTPTFDDADVEGILALEQTSDTLVVGGEFASVNGDVTRNLTVFRAGDWEPIEPTVVPGDVDCDGTVSVLDALAITQFAVGDRTAATCPLQNPATDLVVAAADINNDGAADDADALLVLQCLASRDDRPVLADGSCTLN